MIGMINHRRQGHLSLHKGSPWPKAARAGFSAQLFETRLLCHSPARAGQRNSQINSIGFVPRFKCEDSVRDYEYEYLGADWLISERGMGKCRVTKSLL
jgi:hypothetical protein